MRVHLSSQSEESNKSISTNSFTKKICLHGRPGNLFYKILYLYAIRTNGFLILALHKKRIYSQAQFQCFQPSFYDLIVWHMCDTGSCCWRGSDSWHAHLHASNSDVNHYKLLSINAIPTTIKINQWTSTPFHRQFEYHWAHIIQPTITMNY